MTPMRLVGREGPGQGPVIDSRPHTEGLQLGTWGPRGHPSPNCLWAPLKPDQGCCGFLLAPLVSSAKALPMLH